MSSDENQKFGLAGNEQAQGYEPMPMALPVEPTTALDVTEDMGTDHPTYKHLTRPDGGEPVDRSYKDVRSGEEIDPKFSVSQAQAASDLARVRAEERQARDHRGVGCPHLTRQEVANRLAARQLDTDQGGHSVGDEETDPDRPELPLGRRGR